MGGGGGGTSNYSDPHHEDEKGAVNFHTPYCAWVVKHPGCIMPPGGETFPQQVEGESLHHRLTRRGEGEIKGKRERLIFHICRPKSITTKQKLR